MDPLVKVNDPFREGLGRIVLTMWAIALCVICIRVLVQPIGKQSGFGTYYDAGLHWRTRQHLYTHPDDHLGQKLPPERLAPGRHNIAWGGFRYPVPSAVLFTPLSVIPRMVGEMLFRVLMITLFLATFFWCLRVGLPDPRAERDWPILLLLILWPFAGALNNAQASCIVISCLLGAAASAMRERWWLCAACVVIGACLKIYPLAFGLLLLVTYPRAFALKLIVLFVLAAALPFLLRPDHWTLEEHRRWLWHITNDALPDADLTTWDLDIRLLLVRWFHVRLSQMTFLALEAMSGVLIAAICLAGQARGWSRRLLVTRMLGLATCWMTLLGPATEPSTYVLVAPSLAWGLWESFQPGPRHRAVTRYLLVSAYSIFLISYMTLWFRWGHRVNSYGIETSGAVLLFIGLIILSLADLRRPAWQSTGESDRAQEGLVPASEVLRR